MQQLWASNNYSSARISHSDDEGEDDDEEEENDETASIGEEGLLEKMSFLGNDCFHVDDGSNEKKIHYVFGDVMKPQTHGEKCAISVHCVG